MLIHTGEQPFSCSVSINVDGTVTSNDGSYNKLSQYRIQYRFHNFHVSQLYIYVVTYRLCETSNKVVRAYTDSAVCWNLDPSRRRMYILICLLMRYVTFDLA